MAARQPDVARVRLRPRILEPRGEQVGVGRRARPVCAGVEVAEQDRRQTRRRGATGSNELFSLRDLGRVVERLEMRRDHPERAPGNRRVSEHPAALRDHEAAEERRRGRVETAAHAPDLDLLVDPDEQPVADREPDVHVRRIAAWQLRIRLVCDREEAVVQLSRGQRLAQFLRVVQRDGCRGCHREVGRRLRPVQRQLLEPHEVRSSPCDLPGDRACAGWEIIGLDVGPALFDGGESLGGRFRLDDRVEVRPEIQVP